MYQARQKKHKARQMQPVQQRKNKTGIPDHIKAGTEYLTGVDLSDARVHYNSPKPAQLQAHAYAQGRNIYVAPGQKRYIEHETWHLAGQQALGRVPATTQFAGQPINDDPALEREADVMGRKAAQIGRELTNC